MTDQEAFELIFACNKVHTREQLKKLQSLTLEQKIQTTKVRIGEWYQHWDGKVYVSFSGGKDSTVLLDIARQCYPDIEAVFVDTGLEYPEIRQFVKQHKNVTILHPNVYNRKEKKWVRTNFYEVIKKYGYPVISKEQAFRARKLRHQKLTEKYRAECSQKLGKWNSLVNAPFEISEQCCEVIKKRPFKVYESKTGKKMLTGEMADDCHNRQTEWLENGCNAFALKRPKSTPMAFWTEQDVLHYLKITGIPYCPVYGDIAADGEGQMELYDVPKHYHCTGCQRTGCMFCMFGVHLEPEPNRFQRMKITHPKQYDYCINQLGLGKVLDYINVKY